MASQQVLTLAGPLSGNGLTTLLLTAAERHMYASVIIESGSANGTIHVVNGQIALVGADDVRTMRIAQNELTSLLRASIGSSTGTFRCAPLTNIENAHDFRSVGVQQVLNAVGAISTAGPAPDLTPRRTAAPDAATLIPAEPAPAAPATNPQHTADPAVTAAAAAVASPVAEPERQIRASQLRKILRLKGTAKPPIEDSSVEKILDEPDSTVDRAAALRSVIRDLAS